VRKLKNSKRDENDILKFDFKIEWACDVGTKNDLERITCSIAIERLRVLTHGVIPGQSLCRQTAVFRPAQKWTLLEQAYEWERRAMTELEAHFLVGDSPSRWLLLPEGCRGSKVVAGRA
jgi:hypothetical protein